MKIGGLPAAFLMVASALLLASPSAYAQSETQAAVPLCNTAPVVVAGSAAARLLAQREQEATQFFQLSEVKKTGLSPAIALPGDVAKGVDPPVAVPRAYSIPIVFHVIQYLGVNNPGAVHNASIDFVTAAQVQSQLAVLNRDFGLLNSDASRMPAVFGVAPANANIQFCMATRSPNGALLAEPGINRIRNYEPGYGPLVAGGILSPSNPSYGGVAAWDPAHYLNVWVCNLGGASGQAISPTAASLVGPDNDGIIVSTNSFGNSNQGQYPNLGPGREYGRTLVHEVGHYLGLRHLWGNITTAPSCTTSANDGIADTPFSAEPSVGAPSRVPHFGQSYQYVTTPPSGPFGPCTLFDFAKGVMFMNYMDYTMDGHKYMFTPLQVARMQWYLSPSTPSNRAELLNSVATAPAVAVAHNAPSTALCPGDRRPFICWASVPSSCVGRMSYAWTVPAGWAIANATSGVPTITPDGVSGGSVTLWATYTNGTGVYAYPPVSVTFPLQTGISTPALVVFPTGAVNNYQPVTLTVSPAVANAVSYQWTVPAGFSPAGTITTTDPNLIITPYQTVASAKCTITVVAQSNCFTSSPSGRVLTVNGIPPTANIQDANPLQRAYCWPCFGGGVVCRGNDLTLNLVSANGNASVSNVMWSVIGGRIISGLNAAQAVVRTTQAAGAQLTVRADYSDGLGAWGSTIYQATTLDLANTALPNGYACGPPLARPPYPNPATDVLYLPAFVGMVTLYNDHGVAVRQLLAPGTAAETSLNVAGLPSGLYVVVGQQSDGKPRRYTIQIATAH